MSNSDSKTTQRTAAISVLATVIVIGLLAGGFILFTSKHTPVTKQSVAQPAKTTSPQYKLAACKSGVAQTIANASYLVGTDIAPGSYKVVSQPAGTDWTNINIYNSKAKYDKQGDPSNEQGVADTSLSPQNGVVTYTKLSDGQFMVVDADPAVFTCE